jgi:hypothetical protein
VTGKAIIATSTYPSEAADLQTVKVAVCIGNDDDAAGDDCPESVPAVEDGQTVEVSTALGPADYQPAGFFIAVIP